MKNKKTDKIDRPEEEKDISMTLETSIVSEMKASYLDYAMSVIVARALPDVRDGLKPVQRRIIYSAYDTGLTNNHRYAKCAALVGDTMGRFHPHGDSSIYMALVRMGQDFTMRYKLIDGQGNFGDISGHDPAAMRYTECRLEKISEYLYKDIDKETVNLIDNYAASHKEPDVLPAAIPNILLNGTVGIAVGMATNIPPHNLTEVSDGLLKILEDSNIAKGEIIERNIRIYDSFDSKVEVQKFEIINNTKIEELVKIIRGPDYPTGCTIYDQSETIRYFGTGRGKIIARADVKIEELKNGKYALILREIPYQVNKTTLIEKIADLVRDKKVDGITEIRDETSRGEIKIVVELRRDVNPQKVLNFLYKHTQLQDAFNVNMLVLVNGEPQLIGMNGILNEYLKHRVTVNTNKTLYLLRKYKEREHILEGLKKALDFIDEVIEIIKKSKDTDEARSKLIARFELTDIQAIAILDMQLKRLAALEREKIENELKEIQNLIKDCMSLLKNPDKMVSLLKSEIQEIKDKFGDERLTKVIKGKIGEMSDEDLIEEEETLITITKTGYIKRVKPSNYKSQSRGGKGIVGMKTKEEDEVSLVQLTSTHSRIMFFTNTGKVFEKNVWDIPEATRNSKGTALVNIIEKNSTENIEEIITIDKSIDANKFFITLATKRGFIKKTQLSEYENIRRTGIATIGLKDNDRVVRAKLTDGNNDVIIITREGKSIRFKEKDARPMGRSAGGVTAIKLKGTDEVVAMEVVPSDNKKDEGLRLLAIMERGYGKSTPVNDYPLQNRSGSGVICAKVTEKTGKISAAKLLNTNSKDILLTSDSGQMIRIPAKSVPTTNRATQGVILMRLNGNDKVSGVSVFEQSDETEVVE